MIWVKDERPVKKYPVLCDDYIEKMANFYTSPTARAVFPYLQDIPFETWLYRQYFHEFGKRTAFWQREM